MHACTYVFVISDALFIAIRTHSERRYFKAPFYLTSSSPFSYLTLRGDSSHKTSILPHLPS